MDKCQQTVCAIALFANGYSKYQVGDALGVAPARAQEVIEAGADAQSRGEMENMKQHHSPWSRDPVHGPNYTR